MDNRFFLPAIFLAFLSIDGFCGNSSMDDYTFTSGAASLAGASDGGSYPQKKKQLPKTTRAGAKKGTSAVPGKRTRSAVADSGTANTFAPADESGQFNDSSLSGYLSKSSKRTPVNPKGSQDTVNSESNDNVGASTKWNWSNGQDGASRSSTIDENALFSDTSSIVNASEVANMSPKKKNRFKNTRFNGIINSALTGNAKRKWSDVPESTNVELSNYIVGNFMLDIRLPNSGKGFFNLEMPYIPSYSMPFFLLREFFFDGNIGQKVYLRMGKQVLQWGRCKLWNPTDLINVEKNLFIPKIGYREGAYGLKMHAPFGTNYNLYGFIDTKNMSSADSLAAAMKFEFLVGSSEMAFSTWLKSNNHPVTGYDFSTRLGGFDIVGELSVSGGANTFSMVQADSTLRKEKSGGFQTKACIDIGREFSLLNFPRNLSMNLSFYYNSIGYSDNLFMDTSGYAFDPPLFSGVSMTSQFRGTKQEFLQGYNLYEQHNYSKYYVALFTQIDRLFLSSLTSTFNVVANCSQASMILSTGLTYTSLHEFFSGILVSAYVGKENTEYTFQNQALSVQINVGMTFY